MIIEETIEEFCERNECESCMFGGNVKIHRLCGLMRTAQNKWKTSTEANIYDQEGIHTEVKE